MKQVTIKKYLSQIVFLHCLVSLLAYQFTFSKVLERNFPTTESRQTSEKDHHSSETNDDLYRSEKKSHATKQLRKVVKRTSVIQNNFAKKSLRTQKIEQSFAYQISIKHHNRLVANELLPTSPDTFQSTPLLN